MNKRKEKERKIKKRRRRIALFLMICAVLLFTWWFNNYTLKINSFEIKSGKLETPVRIAVIADLHANPNGIDNDTILKKLKKAEPDAVFMLGDMYTRKSPVEIMQIPVNLTAMIVRDICPVYFVTGDHDTDKNYLDAISKTGAEVKDTEKIGTSGPPTNTVYGYHLHFGLTSNYSTRYSDLIWR